MEKIEDLLAYAQKRRYTLAFLPNGVELTTVGLTGTPKSFYVIYSGPRHQALNAVQTAITMAKTWDDTR